MSKKFLLLFFAILFSLVIVACNDERSMEEYTQRDWHESPLFESGDYKMIGEEGRIGFIYDDCEVVRFYPEKENKYMWHFWGSEEELLGDFKVVGTHENSDEEIVVIPERENNSLSPTNGADQHIPSNMKFPESGIWKLDAYIGDELFGNIYIRVHDR